MNWRQYGRNGVLLEFAEKPGEWAFHKARAMTEALARKPPPQLVEFVSGYTTILLEFDLSRGETIEKLAAETIQFLSGTVRGKSTLGPLGTIPVRYDGADLERVAAHNNITVEQVIRFHTAPVYKVYLLGFPPAFPFRGELHHKLHSPRLESPRPKVAAGSVAIGGKQAGIYTVDSPGGWNIIGHTQVKLFDLSRALPGSEEDAFHLKPGDQVRFEQVT